MLTMKRDYIEFVDQDIINQVSPSAYGLTDQVAMAEFKKIKKILEPIEVVEDTYYSWDNPLEKPTYKSTIVCVEGLIKIAKVSAAVRPEIIDFLMKKMVYGDHYYNEAMQQGLIALSDNLSVKQLEDIVDNASTDTLSHYRL
jgi:hypothetical protein